MWAIFYAIKRSWTQHFVAQLSGFTILILTYSAVLFIALTLTNIQSVFDIWGRVNKVTIYLKGTPKLGQLAEMETWLKQQPIVSDFRQVLPEESSSNFEKRFSQVSKHKIDQKQLRPFFPMFYEIQLNEKIAYGESGRVLDDFADKTSAQFGFVSKVSYGKKWLQRYSTALGYVNSGGWIMILLFMMAALVVSASVIKTILFNKREEIEILEFIGADEYTIYLPQIVNVVLVGGLAFSLALFCNYFLFDQFLAKSSTYLSLPLMEGLNYLSISMISFMFLLSVASIAIYSIITIYNLLPSRKKTLFVDEVTG